MKKTLVSLVLAARLYLLAAPIALNLVGAGLNQAVLAANGGKFPVMLNEKLAARFKGGMIDEIHCVMTSKTRLNWLADFINLHISIMSPGDLFIELSEFLWSYAPTVWGTVVITELSRKRAE